MNKSGGELQGPLCSRDFELTDVVALALFEVLPTSGDMVSVRTQQRALERWDGDDPQGLATPYACQGGWLLGCIIFVAVRSMTVRNGAADDFLA